MKTITLLILCSIICHADSNAMKYSSYSGNLTLDKLTILLNETRQDQKEKDASQWMAVSLDEKREPVYLQSPNGKYKIGPLYVKPGIKWEPIK